MTGTATVYTAPEACLSAVLLAHQLPPISKFSGDDISEWGGGESFKDWIDQLEMVASISNWDERTKLVNLTRLRGQAYAFYTSCSVQQRGNYTTLVAVLTKRFTPVQLKAVQCDLFPERKQKVSSESVDTYAQDLRRLFYLAYPQAQQGTQDAEDMGQSVLCCQFVTGLQHETKL